MVVLVSCDLPCELFWFGGLACDFDLDLTIVVGFMGFVVVIVY